MFTHQQQAWIRLSYDRNPGEFSIVLARRQPPAPVNYLVRCAFLVSLYYVAGRFGLILAGGANIALIWIPTGIALAALILGGLRYFPAIWVAAFLVNYIETSPFAVAAAIATGNTLEAVIGATMVYRIARVSPRLNSLRDVTGFVLCAVLVAPIASASIGAAAICASGSASWDRFTPLWAIWWISNAAGALVVAPAVLIITAYGAPERLGFRRKLEAAAAIGGLLATAAIPFGGLLGEDLSRYPFSFLPFPFLIWLALRFGPQGAAIASLLLTGTGVVGTVLGYGPFSQAGIPLGPALLSMYLSVVSLTTLIMAALLVERRRVEDQLEQFFNLSLDMLCITGSDGMLRRANPAFERVVGYSEQELGSKYFLEWIHPDDRQRANREFQRLLAGCPGVDIEVRWRCRDGTYRWLEWRAAPPNAEGLIFAAARDITERKSLETHLASNPARLKTFVEHIPAAVAMFDKEMRYLAVSRRWLQDYRLGDRNIIGLLHYDVFPEVRDMPHWIAAHQQCLAGAILRNDRERFVREDGSEHWIQWELRPWFDEAGEIGGILMLTEVITDRVHAEAALAESEERFRQMAEHLRDAFYLIDWRSKRTIYISPAYQQIWGRPIRPILNGELPWARGIHDEDLARLEHAHRTAEERGGFDIEYRVVRPDGVVTWVHDRAYPIRDAAGTILRLAGVAKDITERKRSEEILLNIARGVAAETGEAFFKSLVIHLATALECDCAFIAELDTAHPNQLRTRAIFAHGSFWQNFEIEITSDMAAADVLENGLRAYTRNVQRQYPRDLILQRMVAEGFVGIPLHSGAGSPIGLLAVFRDRPIENLALAESLLRIFAARGEAELKRLRADHDRVRLVAAIEQADEAVLVVDPQGRIEFVNPAFSELTGLDRSEVQGLHAVAAIQGDLNDETIQRAFEHALAHRVWRGRIRANRQDGAAYQADATVSPIRDDSGAVTGFVAVLRDVTRTLELEAQLEQARKLEAIGTLAGGIAHDFNNLLYGILGYTELALQDAPPGSPLQTHLQEVRQASERAAELVRQILAFSRKSSPDRAPIRFQPVLRETINLMRRSLPATIGFNIRIDEDCGPIMASATQLQQVLINLCMNAYQAAPNGHGTVDISWERVEADAALMSKCPDLRFGPHARLIVEDNGRGMDAETLKQAFDPYFTTKGVGAGTGLGLATVHGIVKSHGGAIRMTSRLGFGTRVEVYLPITEAQPAPESEPIKCTAAEDRLGVILVVDDELMIVRMLERMLQRRGYTVRATCDSRTALDWFMDAPGAFDVVISDQTMPHLTGLELAGRIHQARPELPVILCSGYGHGLDESALKKRGVYAYLEKPIKETELLDTVRDALEVARRTLSGVQR